LSLESYKKALFQKDNYQIPFYLKEKHIPCLDGLRALAIIFVILSHIAFNFSNKFFLKLELGSFGVNIFFVISGFLITSLLLKEQVTKGSVSFRSFYIRRALRILPVAYLFIFVLIILNYLYKLNLSSIDFLRTAFFCENFVGHPKFVPNGHFWSLSTEEQFYLLFPIFLVKDSNFFFKLSFLLFLFAPLIIYSYYHINTNFYLINYILFFLDGIFANGMLTILIGCISAVLFFRFPNQLNRKFNNAGLLQFLLLVIAWCASHCILPIGLHLTISSFFIAAFVISLITNKNTVWYKILNYKPVKYIGILSYSLYIWQQIFTFNQPWASSSMPGTSIALNTSLLIIVAMLSYHGYEKQFLKLKSRFTRVK